VNPKIKKINGEINRTKDQIAEYQEKLRLLEDQKCELENSDIINLIRKKRCSDDELIAYVRSLRKSRRNVSKKPTPPDGTLAGMGENPNEI